MEHILLFRETIVAFYKRYESVFLFCLKLIAGIIIFRFINSIGYYRDEFVPLFTPPLDFPYIVLSGILFAVLPPTLVNGLILAEILIQISLSLEVAVFVFLLLFCVLVFYVRLNPKRSFLIIFIILSFYLKLPALIVLFCGLFLGIGSIIPIVIGTLIYQFIPFFAELVKSNFSSSEIDMMALPERFLGLYKEIYAAFVSPENYIWIYTAFSSAMVILAVYAISRLSVKYSKELAILCGGIIYIICNVLAAAIVEQNADIGNVIIYALLSMLIVAALRFFDNVLDYKRTERVQYEDEENFYYVKIVPKINVSLKKKQSYHSLADHMKDKTDR